MKIFTIVYGEQDGLSVRHYFSRNLALKELKYILGKHVFPIVEFFEEEIDPIAAGQGVTDAV